MSEKHTISADTIIRTVILALALVNQVLTSSGKNPLPFSENTVYEFLTLAITIGASAWAWWKNNSFTQAALQGDEVMHDLKKEKADKEVTDNG